MLALAKRGSAVRRAAAMFVGIVLVLSQGNRATAASEDAAARAKSHFEEGSKAFALGEFMRAVEEYKAAYNAKPDPVFLYNIAQAFRLSNDLPQAVFFYKSFLSNMPDAPNRREVERRIKEAEQQIAKQREIAVSPPNVPVAPASESVEPARRPAATASVPTHMPSEALSNSEALVAPVPTGTSSSEPSPSGSLAHAPSTTRAPVYKKWWLWTSVGVGAVAVGLGLGLGLGLHRGGVDVPASHFGVEKVF